MKIKETTQQLVDKIKNILKDQARARIRKNQPRVRSLIKYELYNAIYECPEMESLRSGKLKWDFGLDFDPSMAISEAVSGAFKTKYIENQSTVAQFEIDIQPLSYLEVLELPEAVQITERGEVLPWLEWLLTYGSTIVCIDGFGVKYASAGRSGGAVMIEGYNFGQPFMVDPLYAGTKGDNFITRAISANKDKIIGAAWEIIK